jgi:addiction module HigA family antidote
VLTGGTPGIFEMPNSAAPGLASETWGTRSTLSSVLNGKAGLSGEMALRIEKAFGVKMDTLMRMQSAYEIERTRKREKLIRVMRIDKC